MTDTSAASTAADGASAVYTSFTSSVQRALPVASTLVSEATGFAALSESYSNAPTQPEPTSEEPTSSTSPPQQERASSFAAREDHQEELERGPSSNERPSQNQKHIGTETGIPTTGGAGTTASPDDDVRAAIAKEHQKLGGAASQAAVGVDYSDQPCPTSDARRETPTSKPAEGKTQFESREEQLSGASANRGSDSNAAKSDDTAATSAASGEGAEQDGESGKAGGASLKDKLKGQAKVVAGKITRNEEKVQVGKMLKAGASTGGDA